MFQEMSHIYDIGMLNRMNKIFCPDSKSAILAIDHRQRGLQEGIDNFDTLLEKIKCILPFIDGIMTTKEPLAELICLNHQMRCANPLIDKKALILSLNRTGLAGSCFEMDDRLVAFPEDVVRWGLDGAKVLIRFNLDSEATNSQLEMCREVASQCRDLGIPLMVEALYVVAKDGKLQVDRSKEKIKYVAIICNDFHVPILKLPYPEGGTREERMENFKEVVQSVNAVVLVLGGPRRKNRLDTLIDFQDALLAGACGFVVGRNIFLDEKPQVMAYALRLILHENYDASEALEKAGKEV